MKKIMAFALSLTLAAALAACGGAPAELTDGTYTAEMSDAYATEVGHGYKPTLTITVSAVFLRVQLTNLSCILFVSMI